MLSIGDFSTCLINTSSLNTKRNPMRHIWITNEGTEPEA